MTHHPNPGRNTMDQACQLIGQRAANLYRTRQLWCSGAALVVLNQALGGDLTQELAIRLAAGLGDGMGHSGCLCGALNGGALALGLFLGTGRLSPGGDKKVLEATHQLHNRFKAAFGSACCRILIKNHTKESAVHNHDCALRTAAAAEFTAVLILAQRPELSQRIDWNYLNQKEGKICACFNIIANQLIK